MPYPDSTNIPRAGALAGVAGAFVGVTYGFSRQVSPIAVGSRMALNWTLITTSVLGTRQYIVKPVLHQSLLATQNADFKESTESLPRQSDSSQPFSGKHPVPDLRPSTNVADTGIAGGLVGTIFNFAKRGPAGILPGAVTAFLACSAFQWATNSARLARIRMVTKAEHTAKSSQEDLPTVTLPEHIINVMSYIAPIKKLTPEEYAERMAKQQKLVEKSADTKREV